MTDFLDRQTMARKHYFQLRDTYMQLQSESPPDRAAIDSIIDALMQAQLAFKATHGLHGNNPNRA